MSRALTQAPALDSASIFSRAMLAVLAAQFLSAFADNALLFAALKLLEVHHYPDWTQPVLQLFFVGAYILLAPFAGPFADAWPKGRVMLVSNACKLLGAFGILGGVNPFVAYGVVGVGAALYTPAKYGILSELNPSRLLVQANGLIEASTIAAILSGTVAGGVLADKNIALALAVTVACYGAAALANLLIPRLAPAHPLASVSLLSLIKDFYRATRTLLAVPDARFSMGGTSLFWGAGSTMRFLLIAWVPIALGITNIRLPGYLNGVVAVGVVIGAALAAKLVTLDKMHRAMPAGILIGLAVCFLSTTTRLPVAVAVLILVGACGGFFVVPLNALLQVRGHDSVGAGHAIAVQNLVENLVMLIMVGAYTLAMRAGWHVNVVAAVFGAFLAVAMALLWMYRSRKVAQRLASATSG